MSETALTRPTRPMWLGMWHAGAAAAMLLALAGCASSAPEREATMPTIAQQTTPPPPTPVAEPQQPPEREVEHEIGREVVRPSHPVRYTVQRGDTLWDIAARFLRDPWVWPEIWQVNPEIENPHLIYPGDVITLAWVGSQPRLQVARPSAQSPARPSAQPPARRTLPPGGDVERLQPRVRRQPLEQAIPSIPADAIRQFLNRPRVATAEQIERAPYILGNYEGRLISATGNRVFAKGFPSGEPSAQRYNVVRVGAPLHDPETDELLGYELVYAAKAKVLDPGPPVLLQLTDSTRGILSGDRLILPDRDLMQTHYLPHVPERPVEGQIIHLIDAISQVASHQVVVVNLGQRDGLEVGHVLAIEQSGGIVADPYAGGGDDANIKLPPQRIGAMMLFKVFDRLAYALVLKATQPIHLHDTVVQP